MPEPTPRDDRRAVDSAGVGGRIVADAPPGELRVHLDDGVIVEIEPHLLQSRPDGTAVLRGRWRDLATTLSIPRVEEHAEIATKPVSRGSVVITKRVEQEEVEIEEPGLEEDLEIERVEVNRFVDAHPDVRTEGDTLVIPCVEEVVVVEKRLRVREELRIRRVPKEVPHRVTSTVRREAIDVETRPPHADEDPSRRQPRNPEEEEEAS